MNARKIVDSVAIVILTMGCLAALAITVGLPFLAIDNSNEFIYHRETLYHTFSYHKCHTVGYHTSRNELYPKLCGVYAIELCNSSIPGGSYLNYLGISSCQDKSVIEDLMNEQSIGSVNMRSVNEMEPTFYRSEQESIRFFNYYSNFPYVPLFLMVIAIIPSIYVITVLVTMELLNRRDKDTDKTME